MSDVDRLRRQAVEQIIAELNITSLTSRERVMKVVGLIGADAGIRLLHLAVQSEIPIKAFYDLAKREMPHGQMPTYDHSSTRTALPTAPGDLSSKLDSSIADREMTKEDRIRIKQGKPARAPLSPKSSKDSAASPTAERRLAPPPVERRTGPAIPIPPSAEEQARKQREREYAERIRREREARHRRQG